MIETILVATDGSGDASAAEQTAMGLASRLGARLSGISVIDDRLLHSPAGDGLALPPFPEAELSSYYRARGEAVARRFGERARAEGLEASCEVLQGAPDDRVVERVQGADLLVIGRTGAAVGERSGLIGATVDSVLRKTTKPTILVPAGAPLTGPLVLGFDGSPGSRIAAKLAVTLANGLNEAVHVFVDSKDKGRAVARFDEVRQLVGGLSVPVRETSSTLGRPDVKIVDTAKEVRASLIVMGAYGRNRITEYFLGSNAASVARTSPVSVLLAR
ncbi:MAG: universal stress protein [Deltaproteobacteria bacterium]|jgi:nucleotide-binding universal stress UspA family protein|nr:universal stress protein [Deltaproteobacteria bacterium]MBW2499263.1 universal stress protein [Deltaproteobacteria bacterium]